MSKKRESETHANEDEDLDELRGKKDKLIAQVAYEGILAVQLKTRSLK